MIRFKGKTDDGQELVAVQDYSRRGRGEIEFTFRAIENDEPIQWYFDRLMNKYWYLTGKNKRKYHEDE